MRDSQHDDLYAEKVQDVKNFVFDDSVVDVFDNMIQRSVPGYGAIITMIGFLADKYVTPNSRCYDLGCSLGASTLVMRAHIQQKGCRIIAVDNSSAMIEKCQKVIDENTADVPVDLICSDLQDVRIQKASLVVMNFTLQFVEQSCRKDVLQNIYDGMLPGGVLIISEKIKFLDDEQEFQTDMHYLFKKLNGYSALEISQKRTALENVLVADTFDEHRQRLLDVGFSKVHVWFQCFNFASMVAIK